MKTLFEYIQKKQITETDYVDLSLPSGTKWAKMNIGATQGNKPEDWYGLYFAWGETKGYKLSEKHNFSWDNYRFGTRNDLSKYNSEDKLTQLEKEDDVVYQKTNGQFRMPTDKELEELYQETNNTWVKNYNGIKGLNGRLFTSKQPGNTNTLFIPASGDILGTEISTSKYCSIWSSILNHVDYNSASYLYADSDSICISNSTRYLGFNIRGVF